MSDEAKIYVPRSSAKLLTFGSGKTLLKVSFQAEAMIQFLREHANERGYVNLCITERRSKSERGDTHTVWLDQWKPKAQQPQPASDPWQGPDNDIPFAWLLPIVGPILGLLSAGVIWS